MFIFVLRFAHSFRAPAPYATRMAPLTRPGPAGRCTEMILPPPAPLISLKLRALSRFSTTILYFIMRACFTPTPTAAEAESLDDAPKLGESHASVAPPIFAR